MWNQDGTTTSPTLLRSVRDWRNLSAWQEFFRCYDAYLEEWFREHALDPATADEIRQRVWIELADRIRTFRYDPKRSFRGWLRQLCRFRTIDYLRERQRESQNVRQLDDAALDEAACKPNAVESSRIETNLDESESSDLMIRDLAAETEAVQVAARKRVQPKTWEVFWQIAIADRPIRDVATEYGMTYAAAFEAYSRAGRILREEGERRMAVAAGAVAAE